MIRIRAISLHTEKCGQGRSVTFILAAALLSALALSCAGKEGPSVAVKREQLFSLSYGPAEDQLNLFQIDGAQASQKTCLTMREGIFYIANGAGAKVVRFSSFGDPLSMIYNADLNPEPIVLKAAKPEKPGSAKPDSDGLGRMALPYPFRSVGELAVDSRQRLYVEDRLPPERRVQDKDSGALLDHVILRFGKDGQFIDYLGQEGIGGTPFPFLLGLYAVASDDIVVVSMSQSAWFVHWFDENGVLLSVLKLRRSELPQPEASAEAGQGLIASLDRIVPDVAGRALLIKVDYYKDAIDPSTKASAGAEFSSSWIFRMDLKDGKYVDRWQIHAIEKTAKADGGQSVKYSRIPGLIGAAGRVFFFIYADDEGKTFVSTYDRGTRATARFGIDIADDELYYNAYYLSGDGVLSAILGTKYEARIVWWRFDKLIASSSSGIVK
jgi:hypothetical protein